MHERTRNKIQIFSHDAKQWKAALLADIDPDQLPASYGGTMTDPDGNPNCITKVINFLSKKFQLLAKLTVTCRSIWAE
jgi:hypothetical protein